MNKGELYYFRKNDNERDGLNPTGKSFMPETFAQLVMIIEHTFH